MWRQRSWSTLVRVMVCCLTAPSLYLNQCWLFDGSVQWHLREKNFILSARATILFNELKNYRFKISATSSRGQWVDLHTPQDSRLVQQLVWTNRKMKAAPDSKVHVANMGPIWGRKDPSGLHVGPMKFAIWGPIVFIGVVSFACCSYLKLNKFEHSFCYRNHSIATKIYKVDDVTINQYFDYHGNW